VAQPISRASSRVFRPANPAIAMLRSAADTSASRSLFRRSDVLDVVYHFCERCSHFFLSNAHAAAVERAKRTLALAIAQDQQEGRRLDATNARIADLEVRATAALEGCREDLATEAAESIAALEAIAMPR
jgi:hypothetical protein